KKLRRLCCFDEFFSDISETPSAGHEKFTARLILPPGGGVWNRVNYTFFPCDFTQIFAKRAVFGLWSLVFVKNNAQD
ncbi:MAG TPA: hypothetical protein VF721_18760, partial [Pyrinomonadaceae bacterium]